MHFKKILVHITRTISPFVNISKDLNSDRQNSLNIDISFDKFWNSGLLKDFMVLGPKKSKSKKSVLVKLVLCMDIKKLLYSATLPLEKKRGKNVPVRQTPKQPLDYDLLSGPKNKRNKLRDYYIQFLFWARAVQRIIFQILTNKMY